MNSNLDAASEARIHASTSVQQDTQVPHQRIHSNFEPAEVRTHAPTSFQQHQDTEVPHQRTHSDFDPAEVRIRAILCELNDQLVCVLRSNATSAEQDCTLSESKTGVTELGASSSTRGGRGRGCKKGAKGGKEGKEGKGGKWGKVFKRGKVDIENLGQDCPNADVQSSDVEQGSQYTTATDTIATVAAATGTTATVANEDTDNVPLAVRTCEQGNQYTTATDTTTTVAAVAAVAHVDTDNAPLAVRICEVMGIVRELAASPTLAARAMAALALAVNRYVCMHVCMYVLYVCLDDVGGTRHGGPGTCCQ
jgi:hypothetical protein